MSVRLRRSASMLAGLTCVLALAACGGTTSSASPSPSATAVPSPSVSVVPSAAPSSAAPPPTATPTAPPPASASAGSSTEACAIAPQTGRLPSDRLVNLHVSSTPTSDVIQFVFGPASLDQPPQGVSEGLLQAATPPYTQAASGEEMEVRGDHVAQVRFSGMSITNDAGELMYEGPMDVRPKDTAALREVANYDLYEGYIGFYVGYDGNGCLTLSSDETSVTLTIDHPTN